MKAVGRRFAWRVFRQGAGLIGHAPHRLRHLHVSVALLVGERALGRIDRDLVEIGRTQARKLRVVIGEQTALQQWIIREIDAWHDMRRTVSNLFGFSEEIVRPAIQHLSLINISEPTRLGMISYAVFCLKKKKKEQ